MVPDLVPITDEIHITDILVCVLPVLSVWPIICVDQLVGLRHTQRAVAYPSPSITR
jgi:hypothetical protein